MYKFTNGMIIYSKQDADKAILSGYKLVQNNEKVKDKDNEENNDRIQSFNRTNSRIKKTIRND